MTLWVLLLHDAKGLAKECKVSTGTADLARAGKDNLARLAKGLMPGTSSQARAFNMLHADRGYGGGATKAGSCILPKAA